MATVVKYVLGPTPIEVYISSPVHLANGFGDGLTRASHGATVVGVKSKRRHKNAVIVSLLGI